MTQVEGISTVENTPNQTDLNFLEVSKGQIGSGLMMSGPEKSSEAKEILVRMIRADGDEVQDPPPVVHAGEAGGENQQIQLNFQNFSEKFATLEQGIEKHMGKSHQSFEEVKTDLNFLKAQVEHISWLMNQLL